MQARRAGGAEAPLVVERYGFDPHHGDDGTLLGRVRLRWSEASFHWAVAEREVFVPRYDEFLGHWPPPEWGLSPGR